MQNHIYRPRHGSSTVAVLQSRICSQSASAEYATQCGLKRGENKNAADRSVRRPGGVISLAKSSHVVAWPAAVQNSIFWATVYKTVRNFGLCYRTVVLSCLSVCL